MKNRKINKAAGLLSSTRCLMLCLALWSSKLLCSLGSRPSLCWFLYIKGPLSLPRGAYKLDENAILLPLQRRHRNQMIFPTARWTEDVWGQDKNLGTALAVQTEGSPSLGSQGGRPYIQPLHLQRHCEGTSPHSGCTCSVSLLTHEAAGPLSWQRG